MQGPLALLARGSRVDRERPGAVLLGRRHGEAQGAGALLCEHQRRLQGELCELPRAHLLSRQERHLHEGGPGHEHGAEHGVVGEPGVGGEGDAAAEGQRLALGIVDRGGEQRVLERP